MEKFLSDQSSMASHAVVNYSSSSYGGFLFRSPNSPPPSPSPSPPPSIASLRQLFHGARFSYGSRSPVYCSSPAGFFQLPQPPLLPLPRSATLPATSKRILAEIPAATVRSRRQNAKRKGKMMTGARKEISPPQTKVKEVPKPAIAAMEEKKDNSHPWTMKTITPEKREMNLIEEEEEMMESVYSLSPPPSCLPFPTFSLTRPKASSGGVGGAMSGYCIA
ncbi:hypothetical protein M5K25_026230 [Dendrobium thyrsiflorum]|uniref:Uncharacterized protein n=1 Tax=Dendrobium thyrsiflorum TaxID=117978 RepID=A0ABD0TWW5_DENTH